MRYGGFLLALALLSVPAPVVAAGSVSDEHPDAATSWNDLAVSLNAQGRHAEAERAFRQALALREAALPAGHPDIAQVIGNLAFNLSAQGRLAGGEASPCAGDAADGIARGASGDRDQPYQPVVQSAGAGEGGRGRTARSRIA